jgi:hypothetical protein
MRRHIADDAEDSDWKRLTAGGETAACAVVMRARGASNVYGQISRPKIVLRASALFFLMSFSVRKIFFIGESRPKRIFRMARGRGARC